MFSFSITILESCATTTPTETPTAETVVTPMTPTMNATPPNVAKVRPPKLRIGVKITMISV